MPKQWTLILGLALLTIPAAAQTGSAPQSDKEKVGYALGMELGEGFRKQGFDLDPASFGKGFADAFSGSKTLLTEDQMHTVLTAAREEFEKSQAAARAQAAQKSLQEGQAFLEANKTKDGVITLPSGLQYKILHAGTGKKPDPDDTVVCNYRGTFVDGTEFDSSEKHGGPATITMKGVIPGWTEALQMMPAGSKWQLYVPPQLAYSDHGAGNVIPPNATLIFDVELLSIKDEKEASKERDRE